MKKLIFQFLLFLGIFFGIWYLLGHIPWVKTLHINKFTKEKQQQISGLILKLHRMEKTEILDTALVDAVKSIKDKICVANGIDTATIHTYIFEDDEINAFAIPGGNIIINSSLITLCKDPDMLAGVMAHEIGHIEKDHVTKKLAKEIGITTIITLTGNDNFGVIKEIVKTLTSSKFDRIQETEADKAGVQYLLKAQIDPHKLANFFDEMKKKNTAAPDMLQWISTHPNADERAKEVRAMIPKGQKFAPILQEQEWANATKVLSPSS